MAKRYRLPSTYLPITRASEPPLGNPTVNGYVLSSLTDGTRSWIAPGGGGGMSIGGAISGATANEVLFANASGKLAQDAGLLYTLSTHVFQVKNLTAGDASTTNVTLTFHGSYSDQYITANTYDGAFTFSGSLKFPSGLASFGTTATDGRVTIYQVGAYLDALSILGWSSGTSTYAPISIRNTYGVKLALLGGFGNEDNSDGGRLSLLGNAQTNGPDGDIICYDRSTLASICGIELCRGGNGTSGEFRFWVKNTGSRTTALTIRQDGEVSGPHIVGTAPIGGLMHYAKSLTGVPSLASEWNECNGQTCTDVLSPLYGSALPSINGGGCDTQRFIRGSSSSGYTGGTESHSHTFNVNTGSASCSVMTYSTSCGQDATPQSHIHTVCGSTDTEGNLPSYYEAVTIIRVR